MRANSSALSTIPSGVSPYRFMMRSLSEPWFVPMRMATLRSWHRRTSGVNRSRMRSNSAAYCSSVYSLTANFLESAKLPGLTRTFSTHRAASIAASGLKWMSATMGTSQPRSSSPRLMNSRLRASLTVGAVIRTISHPTAARSIVCWMLASVSIVSQVIIDWTRIGWSPPIPTLPTITSRVRRRRAGVEACKRMEGVMTDENYLCTAGVGEGNSTSRLRLRPNARSPTS